LLVLLQSFDNYCSTAKLNQLYCILNPAIQQLHYSLCNVHSNKLATTQYIFRREPAFNPRHEISNETSAVHNT